MKTWSLQKKPQRRTTETLTEKNKEDKLLDAITRNLLEMELIPLDDEEPILIEEKTKQEEKGVSLTKTNRKEPGENNKRGTTSVKGAMRERSEKKVPRQQKQSPNNPRRNKSGYKKTKKEALTKTERTATSQKDKSEPIQTTNTKIQTTVPRRRENASETKDPRSKLLSL